MRSLAHIVAAVAINGFALFLAAHFISGFVVGSTLEAFAVLALVLTLLNYILKPLLTLFLGPIIVLTLGIGLIIVNAFILYILDIFSQNLTIQNVPALIYATLLVSAINFVFHMGTKG